MELFFNEEKHEYRHGSPDGMILPSVTHIISAPTQWFTPEDAERGINRHKAIELYCNDDLDEDTVADEYKPYLEGYKRFESETGFSVLETELMAHSDTYLFACRIDLIGLFPGSSTKCIIEIKTGNYPKWCPIQTAAQSLCLPDYHRRYGLHLFGNGKYKLYPHTDKCHYATLSSDGNEFLTLLNSKRVREKYGI